MKQKFREVRLSKANKLRLDQINSIIEEYQRDGYTLTLRQLYYQLVSRDVIPNEQKEYAKLSKLLKEGRLGGIVDWRAIEDRLRQIRRPVSWESPAEILRTAVDAFALDRLQGQSTHVEVWVEKDALSQVVERAAHKYQVPVLVNRGYGSISAIYDTYERFVAELDAGKSQVVILYLGDHDPSGLDMIRDIQDRVSMMLEYDDYQNRIKVNPIALTMDQINQYDPPPNPAKIKDPRATWYIDNFGRTSWEVDALPPNVLDELITDNIEMYIDMDKYNQILVLEEAQKDEMEEFISQYEDEND